MVVVLHAIDLAFHYADRVTVLSQEQVLADLPARDALPAAAAACGLRFGPDPAPRLLSLD